MAQAALGQPGKSGGFHLQRWQTIGRQPAPPARQARAARRRIRSPLSAPPPQTNSKSSLSLYSLVALAATSSAVNSGHRCPHDGAALQAPARCQAPPAATRVEQVPPGAFGAAARSVQQALQQVAALCPGPPRHHRGRTGWPWRRWHQWSSKVLPGPRQKPSTAPSAGNTLRLAMPLMLSTHRLGAPGWANTVR